MYFITDLTKRTQGILGYALIVTRKEIWHEIVKIKKEESRSYEGGGRIREVERKVTDIETAVAKIASHFPSLHFPCRVPTTDSWKLKRYRKLI